MSSISFDPEFLNLCPDFSLLAVRATVVNTPSNEQLVSQMEQWETQLSHRVEYDSIKNIPAIFHTRKAYKSLGKDPNRYRPASEQLMRRVVSGKGLYYINTLVDIGNWVSLKTGFAIGVIDREKIEGDIILKRGGVDDDYEGIGRGALNIEGLPAYFDEKGAFATPTSDSERTKIELSTCEVLILINNYIPREERVSSLESSDRSIVEAAQDLTIEALKKYASAQDIKVYRIEGNALRSLFVWE